MTAAEAAAALPQAQEIRRFQAEPYFPEVVGIELVFQPSVPALYEYFDKTGRLFCIAADAVHGPRMVLDGMELTGGNPAELEQWLSDLPDAMGGLRFGPRGNPGIDELGLILRVQDTADGLLTRPVLVGREWAERCTDDWEGAIPESEWVGYLWPNPHEDEEKVWPSARSTATWAGEWSPPF
ncbi:hypothetical protein [Catellatospora sichuanensis]|uniref:hypothetical protein n=1 Tax=Catellatospora sichuanensis TaxID=1969805 RepID=UPI00118285E9|nr:hypothetical protein [Catellatospora sichuanensis]